MRPEPLLALFAKALGLGLALGAALRAIGAFPDLRSAFLVCGIFSILMWGGFKLLSPWFSVRAHEGSSPYRAALGAMLRILGLYTVLLLAAVALVRWSVGLDLVARPEIAATTFLIGLALTAVMTGLHTAERFVGSERARSEAELDRLRLQLLEADHARKTQELEEARRLQLSMLPAAPPECCGMAFAYALRTATEVGGDTYDHRNLPDGSLLLAFGDATGHGLQAGLVVTAVKALFQTLPPEGSLTDALRHIGEGVRALRMPRMAMALTLARLEGDTLRFASAGMPPLLHFRAAEDRVEAHRTQGPPLGQLKHFAYSEGRLRLDPGDAVLFCSDGFPECMDPEDRMLGYDATVPLFQRHAALPPGALLDALFREAEAWGRGRGLADDLSFLAIQKNAGNRTQQI